MTWRICKHEYLSVFVFVMACQGFWSVCASYITGLNNVLMLLISFNLDWLIFLYLVDVWNHWFHLQMVASTLPFPDSFGTHHVREEAVEAAADIVLDLITVCVCNNSLTWWIIKHCVLFCMLSPWFNFRSIKHCPR